MAQITKTNISVAVLNRIRESASVDYQTAVPIATADAGVIKEIGSIIMDSPNLQNEFLAALINRIGKVIIKTRLFENPLGLAFDKGDLPFGNSIEEIFVNIVKAHQYDAATSEGTVFQREFPDIKSQYHILNSSIFYKQSVSNQELEKAFLSTTGVADLTESIVGKMYVSARFDAYLVAKYIIAKAALDGTTAIYPVAQVVDEASAKGLLKAVKLTSNNFEYLSTEYNTAGVYNSSDKESQYLLISNENDANVQVDALAYAFGPAFATADAKKIRIDNFDKFDEARLKAVLGITSDDPIFTSDEYTALSHIEGVLLDWSWFQMYTKIFDTRVLENPENMYTNYWLHVWKVYSRSIFENCVIFASGTNAVSAVSIKGATVPSITHGVAGFAELAAEVTITGLAPKGAGRVTWSVDKSAGATGTVTIDANTGVLKWNNAFTAADTVTVTATSVLDSTKTDSETITVG